MSLTPQILTLRIFDLQIRLRETTENTGLSFRYNTYITEDVGIIYTNALWYYSPSTILGPVMNIRRLHKMSSWSTQP